MKRIFALSLTIALLLTACTTSGESSSSPVESSEPEIEEELSLDVDLFEEGEELSGTLVISSDSASTYSHGFSGIYPLVAGFNELHPNVEVIVEGYNRWDSTKSEEELDVLDEKYRQEMRVNITAGDVPDLIFTDLDYTSNFATTNHIMDLNAFMQNDPTFNKDDYFMGVFEACEIHGKLYNMPNAVNFIFLRMKEDVLRTAEVDINSLETVDYKFLLDVYNKAIDSGNFPDLKHIGREGTEGTAVLYRHEIANAFNSRDMTASFNSPEFIEYLKLTNEHDSSILFRYFSGPIYDGTEAFIDDSYFAESVFSSLTGFATGEFITQEIEGVTDPIPVVTSSEEFLIMLTYHMSIPTNAKNPALAWEFIKYCIYESEEMPDGLEIENLGKWNGDRFEQNVPVNKNNMKRFINAQLTTSTQEEKDKMIALYENALSRPLVKENVNAYLPVYEILAQYYETDGLYTAEETAQMLQERVEVYLKEIE